MVKKVKLGIIMEKFRKVWGYKGEKNKGRFRQVTIIVPDGVGIAVAIVHGHDKMGFNVMLQ